MTGMGIVAGDSHSMLAAATQYGVLGVAMDASPLQFYKSGVITNVSECSEVLSNHAVAIVGYGVDDGVEYWKVRNSYGTQFGEEGYFRIERFHGAQGAQCGISGCVVAATGAEYITGAAWTHYFAVQLSWCSTTSANIIPAPEGISFSHVEGFIGPRANLCHFWRCRFCLIDLPVLGASCMHIEFSGHFAIAEPFDGLRR